MIDYVIIGISHILLTVKMIINILLNLLVKDNNIMSDVLSEKFEKLLWEYHICRVKCRMASPKKLIQA